MGAQTANQRRKNQLDQTMFTSAVLTLTCLTIGGYATHDVTYLTLVQAHYINLAKEDKDGSGNTALHLAVKENDDVAVNGLLKLGCNPNARNNKGETPFDIIIDQNARGGNICSTSDIGGIPHPLTCPCPARSHWD